MSSTSTARADSPGASALPALVFPTETWFAILSELDYVNLRKAARICKTIRQYTQDSTFDAVLFRLGPPVSALAKDSPVSLHPILQKIDCVFTKTAGARFNRSSSLAAAARRRSPDAVPFDYRSVLNEFATSPASQEVRFRHLVEVEGSISSKSGVTVIMLLNAIARFCARVDPNEVAVDDCDECGDGGIAWHEVLEGGCWSGWETVKAIGGNCTKIEADPTRIWDLAAWGHVCVSEE
ncbi:hypothetical protein JCM10212_002285 [Sporobolomyces blumeae]